MLNTVLVADPSLADKLYELTVHIFGRATTFFPVENELGSDAFIKDVEFQLAQGFLSITAGLPLIIELVAL